MKINNLDPKKYKRFFAFGCSFTNYAWPTWADIIGQDIPIYQNWGKRGGGNHFILNSIIEANARYKFTSDDLVIVMWTNKEREDRYVNNEWVVASNTGLERIYGKDWVFKFAMDSKGQLIRDLAFINSGQTILKSTGCHWENFLISPITNIDNQLVKDIGYDIKKISIKEKFDYWIKAFDTLCDGGNIDPLLEHKEVIEIYKHVFTDINKSLESRWDLRLTATRNAPNKDSHPTPKEALEFLDKVWPDNSISQQARDYAQYWDTEIYNHTTFDKNLHPTTEFVRF